MSPANVTVPGDPYGTQPAFNYTLKTDTAPGIACGTSWLLQGANCMLAWQDRGIPDGRILYTWFSINPATGDIVWQGTVGVRGSAFTVGNVSAAYFDGEYWLAWKTLGTVSDAAWTHRPASSNLFSGWSTTQYMGRSRVVDAPTWLYHPTGSGETALIWTEHALTF